MKKQEAYKALGLGTNANQEEVKKAFKKLAAKYHPDVNKDKDAVDNFKKVNSAYQAIDQNKFDDQPERSPFNYGHQNIDLSDFFNSVGFNNNPFGNKNKAVVVEDIELETTILFKESIIGCEKTITYKRKLKCSPCNGNGKIHKNNNCKTCNGTGRILTNQRNMIIATICPTCQGRLDQEDCKSCNAEGFVRSDSTLQIKIPAGVDNSTILRLAGMGNYAGDWVGYSTAFLKINVRPLTGLSLSEQDVVSSLDISLIEALQGGKKTVITIDGEKEIEIPKLIKNKEEIILPNLGVARAGNQRVIVNVSYPDNINNLIEVLK